MSRMDTLLDKAAATFDDWADPFSHDWLLKNEVTLDECESLSETIALAIRVYREVMRMGMGVSNPGRQLAAMVLAGALKDQLAAEGRRDGSPK